MKTKLFSLALALLMIVPLFAQSGTCGPNLTWTLQNGVLIISGTGNMNDYSYGDAPWYDYRQSITSITIPNSVTSIGDYAFQDCSGLTSVTIPNSVTSIGSSAFYGCSGLTSIIIPNSVTSIGASAFSHCSGLTSISVDGNTHYDSRRNCNAIIETSSNTLIAGCKNTIIPKSVTSIGSSAFDGCSGLTSITIPNSVTSIGSNAFDGCSGLTSVTINSNIIVSKAYSDYNNLKSIFGSQVTEYIIDNSVKRIGSYAFEGCSGLTSVTIGNSVTSIGYYAFFGCSSLTSITIGNSVTSIENHAFSNCSSLTSVTLYSNGIVGKAYSWDNNIGSIFGSQVTEYIIGGSVSIGKYAFKGCSGLTSVTIGNSVTIIAGYAFYGCSGLTSITIGNNVTSIGERAFYGCSGLTSVTIPNRVTSIWDGAFDGCSGLTSVTIPNSVTSIWDGAFDGCSGLKTVTLGESIRTIGEYAFNECTELTAIYNNRKTPCKASEKTFLDVDKFACVIYVPNGSEGMYRVADGWKDFYNIQGFETALEDIFAKHTITEILSNPATQVFTLQGNEVTAQRENLPTGTYILRLGNKAGKVVIP